MSRLSRLKLPQIGYLTAGVTASIGILTTLLIFRYYDSPALLLDTRWIVLAGVPLLLALIVGGYIRKFKGFGVELEANLKRPIPAVLLTATTEMTATTSRDKRSTEQLYAMSAKERHEIARLVLVQGKREFYRQYALQEYIGMLDRLAFLEIQQESGAFVALIHVRKFRDGIDNEGGLVNRLIVAIEESTILTEFRNQIVVETVTEHDSLIDILIGMRGRKDSQVVVLDDSGAVSGVLKRSAIERTIVNEVVNASKG